TEYVYDANRNRTLVRYGEATNGNQPANLLRTSYDERDLLFLVIRAEGDSAQSTTQYDYDPNRNVTRVSGGLEDIGGQRVTQHDYDGFDRLVSTTDPMGNARTYGHDANSNRVLDRVDGELVDLPGDTGNVRLSEMSYFHDEMDRLIRTEEMFFDTDTQTPVGDGLSIVQVEYNDNSQVTRVVNDNGHETTTSYDTANRRSVVTDQLAHTRTYSYDDNSNVVAVLELEHSDLGLTDEEFTTTYAYDGLDRRILVTDNVGNAQSQGYDSRNNRVVTTDALTHETRYVHDGINRLIGTIRDMNDDGANAAASPGDGDPDIVTIQGWDASSRLVAQTDDNGNSTTYVYDALSRRVAETHADQTVNSCSYDVHGNQLAMIDASGSQVSCAYDRLDRLVAKGITPGPDVAADISFEQYDYDGLSRLVRAEDDDSLLTRSHDSLSGVTRETLNGQTTQSRFDGAGNQVLSTYPGGRVVFRTFDGLERPKTIHDGATALDPEIVRYDYVGPQRVSRREYGNGTRTDYTHDGISGVPNPPGDFGVKRILRLMHQSIDGILVIDDRSFIWDRMQNKAQTDRAAGLGLQQTHDYSYDDVYRLVQTNLTEDGLPVRDTIYELDGVGNRTEVIGPPAPGLYFMDPVAPDPADGPVNQYTSTSFDSRTYDDNGNLAQTEELAAGRTIAYDYRNQMVEVLDLGSGLRHTYAYDALGRRISKVTDVDETAEETRYLYDGRQTREEQDAAGITQATYVHGSYDGELLIMRRGGADYFYHADDIYSVLAITDVDGNVVERYEYEDYGQPTIVNPFGDVIPESAVGNRYLFTGRRYDPETGWYLHRARYLDPAAGRYTTRDSSGSWGEESALGHGCTYAGNNPSSGLDVRRPSGAGLAFSEAGPVVEKVDPCKKKIEPVKKMFVAVMEDSPDAVGLKKADRWADPVMQIKFNEQVEVLGEEGMFYLVRVRGKCMYVKKSCLSNESQMQDTDSKAEVAVGGEAANTSTKG
ncbi:MAG: hypothetical protein DRJ50_11750, partial [Actinobacteria bacterium]